METEIKSGKEILDDFFSEIGENEELDNKAVQAIVELHKQNGLSDKSLTNALERLREEKEDGEDK